MAGRAALLPDYTTPAELARHLGIAERTVREIARRLGAYRLFGKQMIFLEGDVQTILEAAKPCPSRSQSAARSGTTPALLPVGDYVALAALQKKQLPKESRRKPKHGNGNVISMGRVHT